MLAKLKSLGAGALGLAFMVGLMLLFVLLINGTAAVGAWAYPFLVKVTGFATVVLVPILLILALIPSKRALAGAGLIGLSYLYGASLWIWALVYTLSTWGWFAVVAGLLLGGIGVVPIAFVAALFHTEWSLAGQLVAMVVLTFGCRFVGALLAAKAQERTERLARTAA